MTACLLFGVFQFRLSVLLHLCEASLEYLLDRSLFKMTKVLLATTTRGVECIAYCQGNFGTLRVERDPVQLQDGASRSDLLGVAKALEHRITPIKETLLVLGLCRAASSAPIGR